MEAIPRTTIEMRTPMLLTPKQKKLNLLSLYYLAFVNFGFVFAIPVMVDYVNKATQSGSEGYFFLVTLTNTFGIILTLFIGSFSDYYSRKNMLVISGIAKTLAWVIFALHPTFGSLLLAFSLLVVSTEMTNTSACLYETLAASDDMKSYRKHEQRIHAYPQYILMFGLPLAGFLYTIDPRYPFFFNVIITLSGIIAACFYTEAPREKTEQSSPLRLLKESLSFLKNTPRLRWLTLYSGIAQAIITMIIFVFQAAFIHTGGSVAQFSLAITFIYLARAIGTQQSVRIFKIIPNPVYALGFVLLSSSLFMILTGLAGTSQNLWLFTGFMLIYMLFRGAQMPCLNFLYNDLVTSDKRATTFSAVSLSKRLWMIAYNFLAGVCIASFGANVTLLVFAISFLSVGSLLLWLLHKSR